MINTEDQDALFQLISRYLQQDIHCYAFGGNAMMYYGYKTATKDIDIIFEDENEKAQFVRVITILGYKKMSTITIYPIELRKEKARPDMYTRGDERFDLFVESVFQTKLSDGMKKRFFARHDYIVDKYTLTVFVLSKEDIIFLKSITRRERDFDDIKTIVERERSINWEIIVDEVLYQTKHGDAWAIIDLEEVMQRLKDSTFINKKYFGRLYKKNKEYGRKKYQ